MSLEFRRLEHVDLALVARWLAEPHVAPWWQEDPAVGAVLDRYGPSIDGTDPTEVFVVELDAAPVGLTQRYRLADNPEWRASLVPTLPPGTDPDVAACIDYLIGDPAQIARGLGPRMIAAFTDETFARYLDVDTVVVAVNRDNRRSWRALEKSGYRRVYEGEVVSDDPSDEGVHVVYVYHRGGGHRGGP